MEPLRDWLVEHGLTVEWATAAAVAAAIGIAFVVAWLLQLFTRASRRRLLKSSEVRQRAVDDNAVVPRVARLVVILVAYTLVAPLLEPWGGLSSWTETLFQVLLIIAVAAALNSVISASVEVLQHRKRQEQRLPFKALAQSSHLAVWVYASVALLSVLSGKDMWAVLTGLTAIGAVLVYVFRDPILGWSAAVQIAANDLLQVGDWISVPSRGVDGVVEEIALTTIKVRNFDKTVTAVPTYTVFSEGFRNWSPIFKAGVRRMMRSIPIDATSVRFCDPALLERIRAIPLVEKLETEQATNLGYFRAWLQAWLEERPEVDRESTLVVRELAPSGRGIPVQFYVFARETRWKYYELLQAEIVDHIFAMLPRFDLRPFQEPTGGDLAGLATTPEQPPR